MVPSLGLPELLGVSLLRGQQIGAVYYFILSVSAVPRAERDRPCQRDRDGLLLLLADDLVRSQLELVRSNGCANRRHQQKVDPAVK